MSHHFTLSWLLTGCVVLLVKIRDFLFAHYCYCCTGATLTSSFSSRCHLQGERINLTIHDEPFPHGSEKDVLMEWEKRIGGATYADILTTAAPTRGGKNGRRRIGQWCPSISAVTMALVGLVIVSIHLE